MHDDLRENRCIAVYWVGRLGVNLEPKLYSLVLLILAQAKGTSLMHGLNRYRVV